MSMFDTILSQVAGNLDVDGLGARVGLSPAQVEQALQALGIAHPQPGDTAQTAAANTGLPADKLQQIIAHLGGEGALGQLSGMLQGSGGAGGGMLGELEGLGAGFLKG